MSRENYRVLVELDAILDTRLATLGTIDVDLANDLGQSEAYFNRYCDNFSLLDARADDDVFKKRYLHRTAEILQYALMTDVLHLLCIGFNDMLPSIERGISPKDTALEVNMYPYVLDARTKELIEAAILHHIPYEIPVRLVYIDMYQLSPRYLADSYDEWYLYNIEPWLAVHQEEILRRPITKVQIVLPKLSTSGNDPLAESFDMEPFKARELIFKPMMSLNYIDLKYFSYNHGFTEYVRSSGFFDKP